MLRYLTTTLISVESLYPGCGILLAGDFNQLKIRRLLTQFKMKQLVHTPTRGNNILDLIITNMYQITILFTPSLLSVARTTMVSFFVPKRGILTPTLAGKL
jgi:hypothetical protein